MKIGRFIVKRLFSTIGTLFILSLFIFLLIHLTPGDPARILLGADASDESVEMVREELGLNKPIIHSGIPFGRQRETPAAIV